MADHDKGATVRLAATIARSRHEADGGMLLEGIHPDTIVEMSLAAKREVDLIRAELAVARAERASVNRELMACSKALAETRAERDAARADIARMNRALADERAAVAIAHERMDALTAELDEAIEDLRQARDGAARAAALLVVRTLELDNARSRVVEQIKKSLPHAMQNAKAVYKYDVNESRARAMAVLIVDEAIQCLHFDDTRESIRAHAAGSGGSTP